MTYNEMYANAIAQLSDTYLTPAYAEAKENFFKVFETLAAAGCEGRVEDCRLSPEEVKYEGYSINQEDMTDMERMVEILRRVSYPRVSEWEWDLRLLKSFLICTPA